MARRTKSWRGRTVPLVNEPHNQRLGGAAPLADLGIVLGAGPQPSRKRSQEHASLPHSYDWIQQATRESEVWLKRKYERRLTDSKGHEVENHMFVLRRRGRQSFIWAQYSPAPQYYANIVHCDSRDSLIKM